MNELIENNEAEMDAPSEEVENKTSDNKIAINPKIFDHVELSLEAFIGEADITVAELNEVTEGTVIELNTPLNQSVDLRLNGISIAKGELVAVGDNFGVRITTLA